MALEINFGLAESILFSCMKLFKTSLPIKQYGSSFLRQQIEYQGDLSFWSFCMYPCLNCYRLCERIYHIYHTALLYDFLQQPCFILDMEIELPCIKIRKCYVR